VGEREGIAQVFRGTLRSMPSHVIFRTIYFGGYEHARIELSNWVTMLAYHYQSINQPMVIYDRVDYCVSVNVKLVCQSSVNMAVICSCPNSIYNRFLSSLSILSC
jgi:hypothetical protein